MNVLMTGMEWFTYRPGGLPRYVMDFSRAWLERGHSARVLVRVPDVTLSTDLPQYVRGLHVEGAPWAVRRTWENVYREELARQRFDVFNPHFAYYAWAWDNVDVEIPMVTHFHGPWAYEAKVENSKRPKWMADLIFRVQKTIEKRVYRSSDQFIVLSQAFRQQLHDFYGVPADRIHVIPGAVDTMRFVDTPDRLVVRRRLNLPEDRFVLLTVRRLARRMGLENLIESVNELRNEFPYIYLVIVGGGSLHAELQQKVLELQLQDWVHFAGRVPDDILPQYYQAADLMVVPSVAFEGFGLVTTESMACGTPVAGTPVGGTKEILERFEPKLLFEGSTQQDITSGLRRLLADSSQLPRRSATRQHVLDHYTWDVVVPQVADVFRLAMQGFASRNMKGNVESQETESVKILNGSGANAG
jgi:glycosyltransferase involved in cell wall biosynthesis